MSVWQYLAAVEGYNKANDPDGDKALTAQEEDELWEFIQR